MRLLREWLHRLSSAIRPRRSDADLEEELHSHLELAADDAHGCRGLDAQARRAVHLRAGGVTQAMERLRDRRGWPFVDTIARDVRYAVRGLRRAPAFTVAAVATLALVIGANTAIGSLVDAALMRPLPYPQADRLASVIETMRSPQGSGTQEGQDGMSWETLRDQARSVEVALSTAGFGGGVNLAVNGAARAVTQARVSANYFHVLRVEPFIGRSFTPDEDRPGGPAVAVVSYALWRDDLRSNPDAVGGTVTLKGEPYRIVGVMPGTFQDLVQTTDVWTPARPSRTGEGGGANYQLIARLTDGQSWTQAASELMSLGRASFVTRLPADTQAWWTLVPLGRALAEDARVPLELLAGAVAAVLLIACVNLAALLLARGASRAPEIAARMALGSGRLGVVRQLVVESLVLGTIGGVTGLVVGAVWLSALKALGGPVFYQWQRAALDGRILAATAGLSVATSLAFGAIPAWQAGRVDMRTTLCGSGSRTIAGGGRHWARRLLVGAQVAVGVVLLVVTGLVVRTVLNLTRLDPGFDAANVTTATASLQDARYDTSVRVNELFDASLDALTRAPGVESAAVSLEMPYRRLLNMPFSFAGQTDRVLTNVMYVTPRIFETLRIPVRRGRTFTDADRAGAPPVVVVNETFARSRAGVLDPTGREIVLDQARRRIVGVVGDVIVAQAGFAYPGASPGPLTTTPVVFVPAAQMSDAFLRLVHTWFQPVWSVRTRVSVNATPLLTNVIAQADPLLPLQHIAPLAAAESGSIAQQRLLMTLAAALAALALVLAAIGVYGLVAHGVAERTREFGIRLALGATPGGTVWQLTLSALRLCAAGAVVGLLVAWPVVAVFDSFSFLFRVEKHDPLTFVVAPLALLIVASAAAATPALRLLRLDPARVLRE